MNQQLRLLIVDDVEDDALLMVEALRRAGYEVSFMIVDEEEAFLHELQSERWELILCDYNLPKFSATQALRAMQEFDVDLPFLVVSGKIDAVKAVELMLAGACDYIRKDDLSFLAPACERELRNAEIRRQNRRAQDDLRESEQKFRMLTALSPIGILLSNTQGIAVYINDKCTELIGIPEVEALSLGWISAIHPDDRGWVTTEWVKAVKNGENFHQEYRWLHADGEVVWTQEDGVPVRGREGEVDAYISTFIDITERKQAERELDSVNRALRAHSECNQVVIRARDETRLMNDICRFIVDVGGYRMAWVGFAEQDEAKTVRPVAQFGFEQDYLDTLELTWADVERGRGPTGTSIRSGLPCVSINIQTEPRFKPWRADAVKRGYLSSGSFPLTVNGSTFGALNIYSPELDAFNDDEVKLLTELADNLAFGITSLRIAAEREQVKVILQESETRFRTIFDTATVSIWEEDFLAVKEAIDNVKRQGVTDFRAYLDRHPEFVEQAMKMVKILDVNDETVRMYEARSKDELLTSLSQTFISESLDVFREGLIAIADGKNQFKTEAVTQTLKGKLINILLTMTIPTEEAAFSNAIVSMMDITERKQAEGNLIKEKVFSEKIIDTSDAIIVGLDKNHRIKLFNKGAEKITGYKSTNVFGKDWYKIFFPAGKINEMEKVWKDSWGQEAHSYTNPILIKNGAERIISWQTTGIYEGEENNHLLISIGLDITERVQVETDLEKSHQQLRDLTRYLQDAREKERFRIAREIHDEFGQALTALKMDLAWMSKRLPPDTLILAGKITTMSKMVDDSIRMVQRIATELRPGLLDDLGLSAAMEWQLQEFAERSGITFELHVPKEETTLNRDFALTLFRIFQEALTNVARHANAASVRVELEVDPGEVLLIIGDDGDGITESELADTTSLGLIGMRERARSIGGDVMFQGVPGQGTTVTVCIPRPAEDGSSK